MMVVAVVIPHRVSVIDVPTYADILLQVEHAYQHSRLLLVVAKVKDCSLLLLLLLSRDDPASPSLTNLFSLPYTTTFIICVSLGVVRAKVALLTERAEVLFDSQLTSVEGLVNTVESVGYEAKALQVRKEEDCC